MPQALYDTHLSELSQVVHDPWEHDLVARLPADFAQQAVEKQAFVRARCIQSPQDLLRGLFAYVLSACSWRALGCWAILIDLAEMSHRAWSKRLRQAGPWLQWLLSQLLVAPSVTSLLPALASPVRVLLIDASSLKQPGGSGDDWRLHLAYDLLAGQMAEVRVTDQHGAEALAPFSLQQGDVVVADRGYGYRKNIVAASRKGAEVLLRFAPSTCPLQTLDGSPLEVAAWLRKQGEGTHVQDACCQYDGQSIAVRVIAQSLPHEAAERARQERRESSRRHGRVIQEDTLFLAGWVLLVSTLDPSLWTPSLALRLYRARWQIELLFKRMKQLLRLNQLRSTHPQTVQATLLALLLAWALQEDVGQWLREQLASLPQVMTEAVTATADPSAAGKANDESCDQGEPVSSWVLTALVLQTMRQAVLGQWTLARLRDVLPRLQRFLCDGPRRRVHQESQIRARLLALFSPGKGTVFNCSGA